VPADHAAAAPSPESGGRPFPDWPAGFVAGERDRLAMLTLTSLPGLTARRLRALAEATGTAAACLAAVLRGHPLVEASDRDGAASVRPAELSARLDEVGARLAVPGDDEYPPGLLDLPDPPVALFVRGAGPVVLESAVAVVGARNCSALGAEVARSFGRDLAAAGTCVVSGAARGIDSAAHEGALAAGGPTVAVLGSGIDVAFPGRSRGLLGRITASGAVISEYPPGVPARPFRFPARNRIVTAMSDGVLVVEGAAGSGSFITADFALDLGRPVFAVPGPVTSPLSEAPLALIRDGATMVRSAADLLADLGRLDPTAGGGWMAPGGALPAGLSGLERRVVESLSAPTLPEVIAANLGCGLGEVMTAVVGLEVRGLVRTAGGRVERRVAGV
jgi:DNA processing protein